MPKLEYDCVEPDDANLKTPERRAALKAFSREIELFTDQSWWANSVEDLNGCAAIKEARDLTDDERRHFSGVTYVYGDRLTRLIIVVDPCIRYSYLSRNVYILQRSGGRTFATQVLDAFYSRFDDAVEMRLVRLDGERLIIVERGATDGTMPPSFSVTWAVYTINPISHRAEAKKIFMKAGRLTNELTWEGFPSVEDDESQRHPPELDRNGRLLPLFRIYIPHEGPRAHETYVWNGKYYMLQRRLTKNRR